MDLATISSIITQTLVYATPLILTALGGTFSERSGVVNVGLEGIMVMGAFSSVVFNLTFADTFGAATPWIACLVGGVVGIVFSLLHAVATINLRADHIISGTAFVAILIAILAWFVIYKTRFGLRLRSVGEHPQAADTLGINVYLMRYSGVLLSGFLGGMGGAVFAQSIAGRFGITTIAGQGFISMAAMIFGKWNPLGAMGAALFFGFAQNLSIAGENLPIISEIPKVYLQAAPYVLTILVLVVFFGKSSGPKANGKNYVKTK